MWRIYASLYLGDCCILAGCDMPCRHRPAYLSRHCHGRGCAACTLYCQSKFKFTIPHALPDEDQSADVLHSLRAGFRESQHTDISLFQDAYIDEDAGGSSTVTRSKQALPPIQMQSGRRLHRAPACGSLRFDKAASWYIHHVKVGVELRLHK